MVFRTASCETLEKDKDFLENSMHVLQDSVVVSMFFLVNVLFFKNVLRRFAT